MPADELGTSARWLLVSTYDLGRQPSMLAAQAARLRRRGLAVEVVDLSVDQLDRAVLARVDTVAWYLPMHTATRLALARVTELHDSHPPLQHRAFGLYAELHQELLRSLGVEVWRDVEPPAGGPFQRPGTLDRRGLPELGRYARLVLADGTRRVVGATDASVGCRHRCRHCPLVPIFAGRFRTVPIDAVLGDVATLVEAGAEHITFSDPDFLNGPQHAMRVVTTLHERFPHVSFDITAKVAHLRDQRRLLGPLHAAGCVLITSAVESFDDVVLERLAKGHTSADVGAVLAACRAEGIGFNPTFVPFTPWSGLAGYRRLLDEVEALGLIDAVHPVQYAIRLLIGAHSALLDLADVARLVGPFDPTALAHPWRHAEPAVDELQRAAMALVRAGSASNEGEGRWAGPGGRAALHDALRRLVGSMGPGAVSTAATAAAPGVVPQPATIAWFTEPWFC